MAVSVRRRTLIGTSGMLIGGMAGCLQFSRQSNSGGVPECSEVDGEMITVVRPDVVSATVPRSESQRAQSAVGGMGDSVYIQEAYARRDDGDRLLVMVVVGPVTSRDVREALETHEVEVTRVDDGLREPRFLDFAAIVESRIEVWPAIDQETVTVDRRFAQEPVGSWAVVLTLTNQLSIQRINSVLGTLGDVTFTLETEQRSYPLASSEEVRSVGRLQEDSTGTPYFVIRLSERATNSIQSQIRDTVEDPTTASISIAIDEKPTLELGLSTDLYQAMQADDWDGRLQIQHGTRTDLERVRTLLATGQYTVPVTVSNTTC